MREKAGGSWGGTSHYFMNIDTIAPAAFSVNVSPSPRTSDKSPIIRFFTTDTLSGFDHFEIKLVPLANGPNESTFFFEASSPYELSNLSTGRYELVVRAYDKADNFRDESVILNILSSFFQFISPEGIDLIVVFVPWSIFLPILIVIIFILLMMVVAMWIKHRHHLRHAFWEDFRKSGFISMRQNSGTNNTSV